MSIPLTLRFRHGHRSIRMTLNQIQLVGRYYSQAKPRLRELNQDLLAHWGNQGEALWERLHRLYADDRRQTKMLEFLIHNLKDLKIRFLVFFEQYSDNWGDVRSRNFPRDFTDFSEEIMVRIKIEEE